MSIRRSITALACLIGLSTAVTATPIHAPGTFTPSAPVVDFESFAVNTPGPITVGPTTISSTSPSAKVVAQGFTQNPGIFDGQYFGVGVFTYELNFSTDMMAVGFGLFDANFATTNLQAFDRLGNLLETLFPPLGPPGGTFSSYVGFSRAQGDIAKIVVTPQAGDVLGIDNVAWKAATNMPAVPLPASMLLLLGGMGGLGALRLRKQA